MYFGETGAPTEAWKCIFPPFQKFLTDRPTNGRKEFIKDKRVGNLEGVGELLVVISVTQHLQQALLVTDILEKLFPVQYGFPNAYSTIYI